MKKLSLLFVMLFVITISNAHGNHQQSDFNLKLWNNSSFTIVLDHHNYGKTTNFYLGNLNPGSHTLQVIKLKKNNYGPGMLKQLLYNGTIKVPSHTNVLATVTPNGQLQLSLTKKYQSIHSGYNGNHSAYISYGSQQSCNSNYAGNVCNIPMSNSGFSNLMQVMNDEYFDNSKLEIVQQALSNNNFTTNQVILIMHQFSFESNKLAVAKLAYSKTVDPQNYFMVNKEFDFSSSVTNLNNYINTIS